METRILRLPEVKARTGLARSTLYKLCREGKFPAWVKITDRASGWREADVEAWVKERLSPPPSAAVVAIIEAARSSKDEPSGIVTRHAVIRAVQASDARRRRKARQ